MGNNVHAHQHLTYNNTKAKACSAHILLAPYNNKSSETMATAPDATALETSTDKASTVPTPPKPTATLESLRAWLPIYAKKSDRTLSRLNTIFASAAGTDRLLMTICYTSLLASSVLSHARLQQTVRHLIERAIALPPSKLDAQPSSLQGTATRLRKLSALISDYRIFTRSWGLIAIYKWGYGAWHAEGGDPIVRSLVYAQVLVNVLFQYLENMAYLSSKGIVGWDTNKQNWAWIWSSRFWAAHVGLDLVKLGYEWNVRQQSKKAAAASEGEKSAIVRQDEQTWTANWRREMVVNLAFAPLTVHWGLEQGLISDFWVGALGSVAGVTGLREVWRTTAAL
ncbi:peroxin 11C [Phlyctema vagabunda]|uniref:Peroxin 11C n=1 Tax=Phlyctema vagabunda TaxID=108571 RepID=A0ABR4PJ08_9HELO